MNKIKGFTPLFLKTTVSKEGRAGFTLLELLIVVIIVGILASLAIPTYQKTVEQGRATEAIANLNILRGAEVIYFKENKLETSVFNNLEVEDPDLKPKRYFDYTGNLGPNPGDGAFTLIATRNSGMYRGNTIVINQNGNIDTSGWMVTGGGGGGGGGGKGPPPNIE